MRTKNKNPDLLNQEDTAKLLGLTQQVFNRYCKVKFEAALVGKWINIKHPLIIEYMEARAGRIAAVGDTPPPYIAKKAVKKAAKDNNQEQPPDYEYKPESPIKIGDISFDKIENLTVKEVVHKYGTMAGFKNYLDALKVMADWKNKELKFLEARVQLVAINPFTNSIFSLIDLAFKRIVNEFPNAIAPQLKAIIKVGKDDSLIQMVKLMEKELSQILKNCKSKVIKDINKKKKKAIII